MKAAIFNLAGKEYGVDIGQILEVIRMRKVTPIPDAANFVEGVISLRGSVVPLINLRKKLGIEEKTIGRTERILVTQIGNQRLGVIVDGVSDVLTFEEGTITPPDEVLKKAKYLIGVAKLGDRIILMAEMGKLLSGEEKTDIKKVQDRVEVKKRGEDGKRKK